MDLDKGSSRTVRLRRKRIEVPVAEGRIVRRGGKNYGVVKLQGFSEGAHGLLREQVDKVRRRGAQGIVLDLRGNGGGLLREGVLVASIFVDRRPDHLHRGPHLAAAQLRAAEGSAIPSDIPVVVLVDRGSASASEIVTGALRDHKRATVVGTRTFGKGVFQQVLPLSNGGVLDITVGEYFLPERQEHQRQGHQAVGEGVGRPEHRARRGAAKGARRPVRSTA